MVYSSFPFVKDFNILLPYVDLIWLWDASHSVYYNVDDLIFSKNRIYFSWKTNFYMFQTGFFWSEEKC